VIKAEQLIEVMERDDEVVRLHINDEIDGVVTNHDFTGVTELTFLIKDGKHVADADAFATYTKTGGAVTIVGQPTNGNISVVCAKADLKPGVWRYKFVELKAGRERTLMAGPFRIGDT
jgi:hypothetical protein